MAATLDSGVPPLDDIFGEDLSMLFTGVSTAELSVESGEDPADCWESDNLNFDTLDSRGFGAVGRGCTTSEITGAVTFGELRSSTCDDDIGEDM